MKFIIDSENKYFTEGTFATNDEKSTEHLSLKYKYVHYK